MIVTLKCRFLVIFSILAFLSLTGGLLAGEDYSWVKPGESIEKDQFYVKIQPTHFPLMVNNYDGISFTGIPALDAIADVFGVFEIEKAAKVSPRFKENTYADDIDRYYIVHIPEEYEVIDVIQAYDNCEATEFAEPMVIYRKYYSPNDPQYRIQWHLPHCGFPAAWDVSQGSDDIVVGIVDSGIDMDVFEDNSLVIHEDLEANLWFNIGEDLNGDGVYSDVDDWDGLDNDDNGYPDDFFGWDFAQSDNWPDDIWGDHGGHGTHVAGIVSAVTDNDTGISGAAFNVKLMVPGCYSLRDSSSIQFGYDGLRYCAENGADIVNLSWGSNSIFNRWANDNIQYALEAGVIIFAAAGNDPVNDHAGLNEHHYPCAYNGVIGISATSRNDQKADFATWGDYVDLVAPGVNIVSTWPRNDYYSTQGTSMASPLAAGLGALMLSVQPDLSAEELLQRMQETAVDVSDLNEDFNGIQYRINADFLLNSSHPSFEVIEWSIEEVEGNGNDRAETSEVIAVPVTIGNIAGYTDATNVTGYLSSNDRSIRFDNRRINIGDIRNGQQVDVNADDSFVIRPSWSLPHYSVLNLTVNSDEHFPKTFELPLTIGQPFYLLVDDDNADNDEDFDKDYSDIESFYLDDLEMRPLVHDTYDIYAEGFTPAQDWINAFEIVLWVTGDARDALNEDEIALLENYLDQGGKLILAGQYLSDDVGDSDFFRDYLHVSHIEDDNNARQMVGITNDPLTNGMEFLLIGGGSAAGNNDSPSTLEPIGSARTIFNYLDTENSGAVYYDDGDDSYKTIFIGFALEAASGLAGSTPRYEFIESTLLRMFPQALGIDTDTNISLPNQFSLGQPYPNPFNSMTSVNLQLPEASSIRLEVVDISGRLISSLHDGVKSAGNHEFNWNAKNVAAGEYFFRLNWSGGSEIRKVVLVK